LLVCFISLVNILFLGIIVSLKSRYGEMDKLLSSIKTRLETYKQIKSFEKDALEASHNLEQWAEDLKYLNENDHDERTAESAESWLHSQIQTANQMQILVFDISQHGSDLLHMLDKQESQQIITSIGSSDSLTQGTSTSAASSSACVQQGGPTGDEGSGRAKSNDSSASSTPTTPNQHTLNWIKQQNALNKKSDQFNAVSNVRQRIQSFIEYLNEREKELHELALKQQRKLGQALQISQLENECTQLLGFISNIEMTLFAMLKFARALDEADQIKKEHELFKVNLERVSVNVNMLQTKAQRILYDRQQQPNRVVTKFEQLMSTLNSKWQMLLIYVDNRTRLVMAQINFYKYTDQV
jgi:hypothetical protein